MVALALLCMSCDLPAPSTNQFADCRDAELSCFAPFECGTNPDFGADDGRQYVCQSPADQAPSCTGSPEQLQVPFRTTQQGLTLHRLTQNGCIPVSYDASFSHTDLLAAAVAQMNAVSCSTLCFSEPMLNAQMPDEDRFEQRIHFVFGLPESQDNVQFDPNLTIFLPLMYFETATGRITTAIVYVNDVSYGADLTVGTYLGALFKSSGFGSSDDPDSVNSSMSVPGLEPSTPSDADIQSLCTLYGVPPYCE